MNNAEDTGIQGGTKVPEEFKVEEVPGAISFQAPVQWHHLKIESGPAPGDSTFLYTYPYARLAGCLNNRAPDKRFKQDGGVVIVFAATSCNLQGPFLPIRGNPTPYGWHFEIDAKQDNSFVMHIRFEF